MCIKTRLIIQILKLTWLLNVKQNTEIPTVCLRTVPNFITMNNKRSVNRLKIYKNIHPYKLHYIPKQEDT